MKKENWIWMPHPGHFIGGYSCRFRLNTFVGKHIVSTVGEYLPDSQVREIIAISRRVALEGKGDGREDDFMKKFGYEEIGFDRLYETMVFKAKPIEPDCKYKCCPYVASGWTEQDFQGYKEAEVAVIGHMKLCEKWGAKR